MREQGKAYKNAPDSAVPVPGCPRLYWRSHGNGTTFLKAGPERRGWLESLPVCNPAKSAHSANFSLNPKTSGVSSSGFTSSSSSNP
uniref:Uncharacterized protein n=1 Tax=Romanomermis culicivorax TaxID=13658 RepID=A0A915ILG7_ROMCU